MTDQVAQDFKAAEDRAASASMALREARRQRDAAALNLARAVASGEPHGQLANIFRRAERAADDRLTEHEDAEEDVARFLRVSRSQK